MPVREALFTKDGRFVVDMPENFAWGPGELDSKKFFIVRKAVSAAIIKNLRQRKKMLNTHGNHSGQANIFLSATLKDAPASEHAIFVRVFINLRSGQKDTSEQDAWANAQDGDNIFVTRAPDDPDAVGWVYKVLSLANHRAGFLGQTQLVEASTWP